MKERIKVGCCGFGMAQSKYFSSFKLLEVQQTFYQPPMLSTLSKWRLAAPPDFEFTLKAWQLITHNAKSPTYKRLKRNLTAQELNDCGDFKLTPITEEAYKLTLDCARALDSTKVLFQCPASFTPTQSNIENLRKFFSTLERPENIRFYWEPRGEWSMQVIAKLCAELELIHVVDPFINKSVNRASQYFRLHGIGGYNHNFLDGELDWLLESLPEGEEVYVLFNNTNMSDDAHRFIKMLEK